MCPMAVRGLRTALDYLVGLLVTAYFHTDDGAPGRCTHRPRLGLDTGQGQLNRFRGPRWCTSYAIVSSFGALWRDIDRICE